MTSRSPRRSPTTARRTSRRSAATRCSTRRRSRTRTASRCSTTTPKKNGLKTIDDLKKLSSFTYLGPPENATRYQGVVGLKQAYGLNNFTFKPLKTGSQYTALDNGQADTIAIFTTDAALASGKYTVLTDTKGIFGFQQVAPGREAVGARQRRARSSPTRSTRSASS